MPPRTNFVGCIDGLETHGVGQSDRDLLHDLRHLYNAAKHDPSWTPSLLDIQQIFSRLGNVFRTLAANNVGLLNRERQNRFHQIFWLAVWDHFIGGDSEVHVIAPYRGGRPPTLDMVYVDLVRWDEVKATLASIGIVRNEVGLIPTEVIASFQGRFRLPSSCSFRGKLPGSDRCLSHLRATRRFESRTTPRGRYPSHDAGLHPWNTRFGTAGLESVVTAGPCGQHRSTSCRSLRRPEWLSRTQPTIVGICVDHHGAARAKAVTGERTLVGGERGIP